MDTLFRRSGILALTSLVVAATTGLFGAALRRRFPGPWVLRVHRTAGIAALASALLHGGIVHLYYR